MPELVPSNEGVKQGCQWHSLGSLDCQQSVEEWMKLSGPAFSEKSVKRVATVPHQQSHEEFKALFDAGRTFLGHVTSDVGERAGRALHGCDRFGRWRSNEVTGEKSNAESLQVDVRWLSQGHINHISILPIRPGNNWQG